MKILAADDHQLIVDDLLYSIKQLMPDAECTGTSDPDLIIPLFKKHRFDVVFLDIEMDDVNGIALAQKIQKIAPRTNIIYITGYEKYALESYKTYASGFLVKPIDEDMLKDALDHLRFPVSNITDEMLIRQSQGEAVIGKKIQKYREERGLTRNEFAEMLGCVMPTIQRWESGTRVPDVTMLMHIAKVLGVGVEDLIG